MLLPNKKGRLLLFTGKMMNIPFSDLSRQEAPIKQEIRAKIAEIIESQDYIYHPVVYEFEGKLASYLGVKHVITVASGTDALILALKAIGIGPGDEVITTSFSFYSTPAAVIHAGGTPVFVDIDPITYNICPDLIERSITKRTKAILPVHLFGQPAEMAKISRIANQYHLYIIEDAAQAIGATYNGNKVSSIGLAGCISFNCSKNLGAYGNGGAVTTNDDSLAREIRVLRNYGLEGYFHHTQLGLNSNLGAIQAGVLNYKLKYLDEWNLMRQDLANYYLCSLSNLPQVVLPLSMTNKNHVFNKFTISTAKRRALQSFLKDRGVETKVFYPEPLHHQPCFMPYLDRVEKREPLVVAEEAAEKVLSLPLFPGMTINELNFVVDQLREFFSEMTL